MKIYTRSGDSGSTAIIGGRKMKSDDLIAAIGSVDESNASIGLVLSFGITNDFVRSRLEHIQHELFHLGAWLANDEPCETYQKYDFDTAVKRLESEIDKMEEELTPLRNFILPGGTSVGAGLHLVRTVVRRCEVTLSKWHATNRTLVYVNRLSDWMFVAARYCNQSYDVKDVIWDQNISPDSIA